SFFFSAPLSIDIYTLSLHDALPISSRRVALERRVLMNLTYFLFFICIIVCTLIITYWAAKRSNTTSHFYTAAGSLTGIQNGMAIDRKSTRLNSSHVSISYAVFCLKK